MEFHQKNLHVLYISSTIRKERKNDVFHLQHRKGQIREQAGSQVTHVLVFGR
jgi:hypothetical protein